MRADTTAGEAASSPQNRCGRRALRAFGFSRLRSGSSPIPFSALAVVSQIGTAATCVRRRRPLVASRVDSVRSAAGVVSSCHESGRRPSWRRHVLASSGPTRRNPSKTGRPPTENWVVAPMCGIPHRVPFRRVIVAGSVCPRTRSRKGRDIQTLVFTLAATVLAATCASCSADWRNR